MSVIFRKQLYENCRFTKETIQQNKLLGLKKKREKQKRLYHCKTNELSAKLMTKLQHLH